MCKCLYLYLQVYCIVYKYLNVCIYIYTHIFIKRNIFIHKCIYVSLSSPCLQASARSLDKKETEAFLVSFSDMHASSSSRVVSDFPGVQWIQTSSPSASTDTRTINTAISLVANTFGYQSIEFQEKALQLFTQVIRIKMIVYAFNFLQICRHIYTYIYAYMYI
jgi:hypothetical protein